MDKVPAQDFDPSLQKVVTAKDAPEVELSPSLDEKKEERFFENQNVAEQAGQVATGNEDYSGFAQKTDPKEIALVRKLDVRIMLSLWRWVSSCLAKPSRSDILVHSMYWLNYLDRNAIALAKLSTLDKDLGLNGTQYNTCVSILFVGYILFGVPANMLLTRIRPSLFLCCIMMCWAVVSLATAFAKNFTGLLLTRFFLGVLEAPYYPGALV